MAEITATELASRFINHTSKHIFLTGKAGTGKTTFLKTIIEHTHKKAVIVAPTGIAALNAGGVTIHSLFQIPFGNFIPVNQNLYTLPDNLKIITPAMLISNMQMNKSKRNLLRELELLIIDEVSMLRADLLDAMDCILRYVRRQNHKAFGGVQLLFIGDLWQLPPVVREEEWEILKAHYNSIYFFEARVLQQEKPIYIELEKIYRQADPKFISLLNNLRNNILTQEDSTLLNNYYKPTFKPASNDNYITLTTHNHKADSLNKNYLQGIKSKSYFFEARIEGEFSEYAYPVEKTLEIKEGAQIMFVKNDPSGEQRFFNGKIGIISALSNEQIKVQFTDTASTIIVEPYEWQNVKYKLSETTNEIEENIIGTFTQYPIKLAWAITVHKSQGLTFDKAIIDVNKAFAPGQIYVALSRLRSLDGLVLSSAIPFNGIRSDENITEFSKTKSQPSELIHQIKIEEKHFYKEYLTSCFDFSRFLKVLTDHVESYNKDENKSIKQAFKNWAIELKETLNKVNPFAEKFILQISHITDSQEQNYLEFLNSRIKAATTYFLPVFDSMSSSILQQKSKAKAEKQTKTYCKELMEIETLCFEQEKRMQKAIALTEALLNNQEFTRQSVVHLLNNSTRTDSINTTLAKSESDTNKQKQKKTEKREKGKKKKAVDQPNTKESSFQLYQQGKTIEEIAQLRSLAVNTIEGHLAYFVTKGKLSVSLFIAQEKIQQIITTAKALDTFHLGPIKNALGDEFSYSDIRFAIAAHMTEEDIS